VRVLLTNDDGIMADGLYALYREFEGGADVTIVAPSEERSAVGHAITMSDPLRVDKVRRDGKFYGFAVKGMPADCVKIATSALLSEMPDLLVSGVNPGANIGIDVIYSGTVSAATEGGLLGIPSIAVSVDAFQGGDYAYAARFARHLAGIVLARGIPRGVALNCNVPNLPPDKIKGIAVTAQSGCRYVEEFHERTDPRGRTYYWLDGYRTEFATDDESDVAALMAGYITIMPIQADLTAHGFLSELGGWELSLPEERHTRRKDG